MSSKTTYHYPDGSVTFDPTLIITGTGTPSRIEQLERENAALRELLHRSLFWLDDYDSRFSGSAKIADDIKEVLRKEAQP